ncbi:MAG: sulfatase [Myxococcota bacterium]|nr:sulfatase [Myxococcota bacterium]
MPNPTSGRILARWALAGALLLGGPACEGRTGPGHRDLAPVVLITVDTLRADRLGVYGHRLDVSPRIDALAESGVRFADATVQWPKTWPSIASLLTGTYPHTTGIRGKPRRLPDSHVMLAELFAKAGYDTAAIVSNWNVGSHMGFGQGFEHFVQSWEEKWREQAGNEPFVNAPGRVKDYTNATLVTDQALRWLRGRGPRDRPFFLWIHYMDPHGPYQPPARYARLFEGAHRSEPIPPRLLPPYQQQTRRGRLITDLGFYQSQYDREIRYLDDEVGRLLDALSQPDLGNPLIVLTADHGESMGEHRYYLEHGKLPYQPTAHVPLLVSRPGVIEGGRVIDTPVGLIDLSATLLELAGMVVPGSFEGTSLARVILGERDAALPEHVFMESGYGGDQTQLTVREGPWKLIHVPYAPDRKAMTGAEFELYHLGRDPGEIENVAAAHPEVVRRLGEALVRWDAAGARLGELGEELDPASLDAGSRAMLEALGYLHAEGDEAPRSP